MWFRILIKRRWNSYAILHIYTFYIPLWYINRLINVENNRMLSLINILNYHLYLFYQFISPSELVPHPSFLIFQSINLFICFVTRNYHSVLNYRLIETIGTVFIFFILFQSYKFVLFLFFCFNLLFPSSFYGYVSVLRFPFDESSFFAYL